MRSATGHTSVHPAGPGLLRTVRGGRSERLQQPRNCSSELLSDFPDNRNLAQDIRDCEHEGDRVTHEILDRLNHTLVTPIDREDILALASALDDIVDYIEEVADYLGLYKIEAPMDQAIKLAEVLNRASSRSPMRSHNCAASTTSRVHRRDQSSRERG